MEYDELVREAEAKKIEDEQETPEKKPAAKKTAAKKENKEDKEKKNENEESGKTGGNGGNIKDQLVNDYGEVNTFVTFLLCVSIGLSLFLRLILGFFIMAPWLSQLVFVFLPLLLTGTAVGFYLYDLIRSKKPFKFGMKAFLILISILILF